MQRPGVQKLLKEVKENNIRCIIVKDMSRFSRDYIEMGTYLNQIFPFMGVRFISINDRYDSRKYQGSTIEMDTAFRTLLYDLYSKDISVKVKASLQNKYARGEYAFGQAPFGYERSKEIKNAVTVNEREAGIVRHIFSLALQGKSSTQIAGQLAREKIPTIMQLRRPEKEPQGRRNPVWSAQAVRNILNNRFYLGELTYGKTVRRSVGSRRGIAVPKEAWKVITDHHEALISEEDFEKVSVFGPERFAKQTGEKHPLAGKLYCGGCGYALNYKPITGKNRYRHFECGKHTLLRILDCCTCINAELLEEAVLLMLNKELMLLGSVSKQKESLTFFQKKEIDGLTEKLREYRREKKQIQAEKTVLYEKYAFMEIPVSEYQRKTKDMEERMAFLVTEEKTVDGRLSRMKEEYRAEKTDMEQVLRYAHIKVLTRDIADTFIKRVHAFRDKRIEIEWNFVL